MTEDDNVRTSRAEKHRGRSGSPQTIPPTPAPPNSSAPTQPDVLTVADDDPVRGLSNAAVAAAVPTLARHDSRGANATDDSVGMAAPTADAAPADPDYITLRGKDLNAEVQVLVD